MQIYQCCRLTRMREYVSAITTATFVESLTRERAHAHTHTHRNADGRGESVRSRQQPPIV